MIAETEDTRAAASATKEPQSNIRTVKLEKVVGRGRGIREEENRTLETFYGRK